MSFLCRTKIYLLIQIFSVFAFSKAAFLCDPTIDCASRKVGDKVPDPDDCHNYYICIDSGGEPVPSDHYLTCADGMYFDQVTALCKTETGTCINACIKTCQTVCVADFDFIPDPINGCSKYFICIGGNQTPASCTDPTPYFNGTGCSPNAYECCDVCAAYCFVANTQVRDPYDCSKYYLCTAGNTTPDETVHFTCSSGSFNPTTGVCDPSLTECTPYCDGAAPSATTTTTTTTTETETSSAQKINIKGDEAKPL